MISKLASRIVSFAPTRLPYGLLMAGWSTTLFFFASKICESYSGLIRLCLCLTPCWRSRNLSLCHFWFLLGILVCWLTFWECWLPSLYPNSELSLYVSLASWGMWKDNRIFSPVHVLVSHVEAQKSQLQPS